MIHSPSLPLWAASINDPAIAQPASQEAVPPWLKLARTYASTRHYGDLAALAVREGETLTLWRLRPLSPTQRAEVLAVPDAAHRLLAAFRLACDARYEGGSVTAEGPVGGRVVERGADVDAWVIEQAQLGGGALVDELGAVALQRSSAHPKARAPFRLPSP